MSQPADITRAQSEVEPLITNLMKAPDRMQMVMALGALTDFLQPGSREHTLAFCVASWQAGRGWLNAAMKNGMHDISTFPDMVRMPLTTIATLWVQEFKNHPQVASEGLLYAETRLWQKGDHAGDWWVLWLRSMLKHGLGQDVDGILKQYLKKK